MSRVTRWLDAHLLPSQEFLAAERRAILNGVVVEVADKKNTRCSTGAGRGAW